VSIPPPNPKEIIDFLILLAPTLVLIFSVAK